MKIQSLLFLLAALLSGSAIPCRGAALGSAFTYQGRLLDGGAPANGLFDFEFALYDSATGGSPSSGTLIKQDVPVTNGLFHIELDFGAGAFAGQSKWLNLGVRAGANTGAFVGLPARQELSAVPHSQYALVAGTVTDGAITAGKIANNAVTTAKLQDGAVTAAKILDGTITAVKLSTNQVLKSLNSLRENVTLQAGPGVTLATNGNTLQIAASASGTNTTTNVMAIVRANGGPGSGINADLFDGLDSGLFALKSDLDGRLATDGGTMTGPLTLQPPFLTAALTATGNRLGGLNEAIATFRNDRNATNVSPAVRMVNTAGTSPNGVLSVSNNGDGYIARFGNAVGNGLGLDARGTLEMRPDSGSPAFTALGDRTGGLGEPVALFRNSRNATNVSPAVRVENTAGSSPNGVLNVSNNGEGYIARFGNATGNVLALDTTGSLAMNAAVTSGTRSVLDLRNDGNGRLATFGNRSEGKLWIDKDGNLTTASGYVNAPGGLFTSGDLVVGGNVNISGTITGNSTIPNLPGIQWGQRLVAGFTSDAGEVSLSELSIRCPAAGFVFIAAFANIDCSFKKYVRLYNVTGNPVLLTESVSWADQGAVSFTWVIQVNAAGYVNLKLNAEVPKDSNLPPHQATVSQTSFNALYFPIRYQ